MFDGDPEIKREVLWIGEKPTPSKLIADRRGPSVQTRDGESGLRHLTTQVRPYESMVRFAKGPDTPWEIARLRDTLGAWRFYDHFRTDEQAPSRRLQVGTRTMALAPDGRDVAAAVQTIYEIGDGETFNSAIENAFPGARLEVESENRLFRLLMRQHGVLRPLSIPELSDGTLRFILLAAALLSPRPAPLMVLNEPEASLHSDLIPALASLILTASDVGQVIVVTHHRTLVGALTGGDTQLIELHKDTGETKADTGSEAPAWTWPSR